MARTPEELEDAVTDRLEKTIPLNPGDFVSAYNLLPQDKRVQIIERILAKDRGVVDMLYTMLNLVSESQARVEARSILAGVNVSKNDLDRLL